MERLEEIKNSLNFYVLSNKLKTTIVDEVNNYSMADNIFGSMILAIAMNSEFKETKDLSKIIRMLILDDFTRLNSNYSLKNNLGEQFEKELDECHTFKTKEARLVFKYRMLDYSLTKLIKEKDNKLEYSELSEEGIKYFMPKNNEEYDKYKEIFRFYYLNFRLKNKIRSGWDSKHWNVSSKRIERISEHIVGTIILAMVINSRFNYNVDIDKIIKMLAIHETGETLIGDITPFDGITPKEKEEIEHRAMIDVVGNLTDRENLLNMLFEFDERLTKESVFAYFCDKLEADLQSKIYQDSGLHHSLDNQENNCVFASSKVQQMLKNGAKTAFDIWYAWDKGIYEDNKDFPDFSSILKVARDNNLYEITKGVIKEKVFLNEEEHKFLVEQLTEIVKNLYQDKNVDCVYITNYQTYDNEKGILCFYVLLKDVNEDYQLMQDELAARTKKELQKINNTGVIIDFDFCDYTSNYERGILLSPSKVYNAERLKESSILFDKSGTITKTRDAMMKQDNLEYSFDLVDYVPPIDEDIKLELKRVKR